jgi:hypothetical protein
MVAGSILASLLGGADTQPGYCCGSLPRKQATMCETHNYNVQEPLSCPRKLGHDKVRSSHIGDQPTKKPARQVHPQ